jgi:uncharacterized membrane protein YjgN (DUF898 family)
MRRHLWTNTEIGGDALEYTGRGKELLLGFLVALAILVPVFIVYFMVRLAAERAKAFASLPLYVFLFLLGQFAIYRARRYRLTRTIWRGIRFWVTGSGVAYAWRSVLWGLLVIVTLGVMYPWRAAAPERYEMGHTFYGDLPGRFAGTGGQLFRRVWWIGLLGMVAVITFVAVGIFASTSMGFARQMGADPLPIPSFYRRSCGVTKESWSGRCLAEKNRAARFRIRNLV